jgi:hypothetical protein
VQPDDLLLEDISKFPAPVCTALVNGYPRQHSLENNYYAPTMNTLWLLLVVLIAAFDVVAG